MPRPATRRLPNPTMEARFVAADADGVRVKQDWVGVPLELQDGQSVLAGFHVDLIGPIRSILLAGLDEADEMRLADGRAPVALSFMNAPPLLLSLRLVLGAD